MQETSAGDKLGAKQETSDKTATSLENSLSPHNPLLLFIFFIKGDKETSKRETTGYSEKGRNRHKRDHFGGLKDKNLQYGFHLSLVSSPVFRGAMA